MRPVILFGFLFTAACSNTVPDTWSGVDSLKIEHPNSFNARSTNSFSLNSKLLIPKIGKGVSYTISSKCERQLSEEKAATPAYTKQITVGAQDSSYLLPTSVSNVLPTEVLLFPEFFESCDFKLDVKNKIGSTDSSEILKQSIDFDTFRDRKLSLNVSSENGLIFASRLNQIALLGVKPFKNPSVYCYNTNLHQAEITITESNKVETRVMLKSIQLNDYKPNHPIDHCMAIAFDEDNMLVSSQRVQILQDPETHIRNIAVHMIPKPNQQEGYQNEDQNLPVITLQIDNHSESLNQNILIDALSEKSNAVIAAKLNLLPNPNSGRMNRYNLKTQSVTTNYFWSSPNRENLQNQIVIPPMESIQLELKVEKNFSCQNNKEVGFFTNLHNFSKVLNFSRYFENDFLKSSIRSGNLFEAFDFPRVSNIPQELKAHYSESSDFQIFYKNTELFTQNKTPNHQFTSLSEQIPRLQGAQWVDGSFAMLGLYITQKDLSLDCTTQD